MSHIPQRTDKDCLNCGTIVQGRYCQNCGQENVVPKETFWHMVTHFFYDITHFDSSFFHTIHHLILKPGFLTSEYMKGRRAKYLHPIRLYVFSSAMFFLLFFSVFKPEELQFSTEGSMTPKQREMAIERLQEKLKKDTSASGQLRLKKKIALAMDTTRSITSDDLIDAVDIKPMFTLGNREYSSVREYDSTQAALPESKRDGWLGRRLNRKIIDLNEKFSKNPQEVGKQFSKSVLHRLPYMLFVSLPLFAFILKLIYIRRRKIFYYADHGVFTIHLYVFTFILLALVFFAGKLDKITGWDIGAGVSIVLLICLFGYLLLAMKRFYGQRWLKTVFKFILITILSMLMMLILFILFMLFSAYTF